MLNLLVLLFAWFSQLFGHASASPAPSTASPLLTHPLLPLPPALLHQQSHHSSTPEWLTFLALGIAAAALFVGLALFANWLHNAGRGPRISLTGPLARLLSLLAALGLSLREFVLHLHRLLNHIGENIQQQPQRLHKTLFPRHAATGSATDIIRYWYGHTVHNAQRAGIRRQPGETTRDYRNKYENTVPAAQQEMRNLSQTYAHVRYSGQRATPEQSAAAQRQAHIIRKALQAWMRQRKK